MNSLVGIAVGISVLTASLAAQAKLAKPVLASPRNAAKEVPTDVTLDWRAVRGASGYAFRVLVNGETFKEGTVDGQNRTSVKLKVEAGTTYRWMVQAKSPSSRNNSDWSSVRSFTTLAPPTPLILVAPANGATDVDYQTKIRLEWQKVPGSRTYQYQLWSGLGNPGGMYQIKQFPNVSVQPTMTYRWRVRAVDAKNKPGAWSETWIFTTKTGEGQPPIDPPVTPDPPPPLTVNAGPAKLNAVVSVPIVLSGSVTGGNSPVITWVKESGPDGVEFEDAGQLSTTATFASPGTYVLTLTAVEGAAKGADSITVVVQPWEPTNHAPIVQAGTDLTVFLSAGAVLSAFVTDDGEPSGTLAIQWKKKSGPGRVKFENANAPHTTVSFSLRGTYVLTLTANDGKASTSDDLKITVNPDRVGDKPPFVFAGEDITVTSELSSELHDPKAHFEAKPIDVALNGDVHDDGLPNPPAKLTVLWKQVSGPGNVTFSDPHSADTRATIPTDGIYELSLEASDGHTTVTNTTIVTVNLPAAFFIGAPAVDGFIRFGGNGFANGAKVSLLKKGQVIQTTFADTQGYYDFLNADGGSYSVMAESTRNGSTLTGLLPDCALIVPGHTYTTSARCNVRIQ